MADQIKQTIRMYGPNDPYFWEVDNLPLEDLLENTARLQAQLNELPDFSVYAKTGELEAKFVKIPDYNQRTLEDLIYDIDFSQRGPQENDVMLFTNGFWRSTDKESRRDLFPKTLGDLHDVDDALNTPSNITDGHVLKWQNGQWEAAEDIEYPYLDDILDVTISSPADGDILYRETGQWRNGWPTNLPKFDNFDPANDGDILHYDNTAQAYVAGSLGSLPNQTLMFGLDGVETIGGDKSVDFGDPTINNNVSWSHRVFQATPGSNGFDTNGYKEELYPIPQATLPDGTAYDAGSKFGTIQQPRFAYITGMTSVKRNSSKAMASLELMFFDSLLQSRGCNFIHANMYEEKQTTQSAIAQHRSFSAWVPIYWNNGQPTIAAGIFCNDVLGSAQDSVCLYHVRCLGVRT